MWVNVILAVVGLITFVYFWMTRKFGYFRSRGVSEVPSRFPFGSEQVSQMLKGKLAFADGCNELYRKYQGVPMVGYFVFSDPTLMIVDLDLAKNIMIKDFDHFIDRRRMEVNESISLNKYAAHMLTMLEGERWKHMRTTFSPIFTSGKLKAMTTMISKVSDDLIKNLNKRSTDREEFNAKDLMVNYMLDSIAICGYGVEANSLGDSDSEFKEMVGKLLGSGTSNPRVIMRLLFFLGLSKLSKVLPLTLFEKKSMQFFIDVIQQSLEYRRKNDVRRNDFIDFTLDALKNEIKQEVEDDQFEKDAVIKVSDAKKMMEADLELYLVSNLLLLFLAGFETSSTILSVSLYFLAKHQEIQERVYNEINDNLTQETLENLDYNAAHSLKYLDMFIHEALRMYPFGPLERRCTKPYKVPGTDFTIPVGMLVQIPSGAIMKDPRYFKDPETFDPEHFSPESKSERNPYSFLAFGQGPRNCIGMRFALMSVKICLIRMVKEFTILSGAKMPVKLEIDPLSASQTPKGGIWIGVKKRIES